MNNEKFVNVYIDILQKTLNDWLLQNVSLQANNKVTDETLKEQAETIQNLQVMVANANQEVDKVKSELEKEKQSKATNEASRIENLENAIKDHLNTIANLNKIKSEYESVKHQIQHVDTFRNELTKEREAHQNTRKEFEDKIKILIEKIDYLQLTPAKRKKLEDEKLRSVFSVSEPEASEATPEQPQEDSPIRDGGSF